MRRLISLSCLMTSQKTCLYFIGEQMFLRWLYCIFHHLKITNEILMYWAFTKSEIILLLWAWHSSFTIILKWIISIKSPGAAQYYRWTSCHVLVTVNHREACWLAFCINAGQEAIQSVSENFYDFWGFVLFVPLKIYNHNYSRVARQSQFSSVLLPFSSSFCQFLHQCFSRFLWVILGKEPKQFTYRPQTDAFKLILRVIF